MNVNALNGGNGYNISRFADNTMIGGSMCSEKSLSVIGRLSEKTRTWKWKILKVLCANGPIVLP